MANGVCRTLIGLAMVASPFAAVPAAADNYDICYKKIEREFGPYTDINWMTKVWDCTAELDGRSKKPKQAAKATGECNFDKRVGSCKGTVRVNSTSGSEGNYAAEITVSSSAPSCSKVEYYLDNTPYQTVLKAANSSGESVYGTSPISKKSFSVDKCTTYESQ
ncbi:hypothetical protein HFO56_02805 [Rhizobium laguerreae]|uniref:hypothetical protein n=1 Tax=Rhizobium laguerreae TaxID=1076926 RepID=UPI001C90DFD1|nr:hypothetical protein [Rhizobium laguerreae]MBY3151316.1 hypothetical protein [Rhizobium laguerreae]